jgi:tryptophan synthase alpha subunit
VADGVIVGSALVRTAEEILSPSGNSAKPGVEKEAIDSAIESVRQLTSELMEGIQLAGSGARAK